MIATKAEVRAENKARCSALIDELHKAKAPLIKKREALNQKLRNILEKSKAKELEVREEIKAMCPDLQQLDELMSSANVVRGMKDNDLAITMIKEIAKKAGEI